jgi:hypothetical protein
MEVGGGSRATHEPKDGGVLVEDASSSSDMSLSTASNTTLKDDKTTDVERKKERRARREAKRKAKEEQQKHDEKMKRKEERWRIREERAKRRAARTKKEEKKAYDVSSSELSSSSDDGDDDASYNISKKDKKSSKKDLDNGKKKFSAVSFNYSYLTNCDKKSYINVPAGKLPHFDGTNFAKWKHLMRAYLIALHPRLWEIVCSGLQPPEDSEHPTNDELAAVHLNGQATSILLSALDGNEYNRVMNVDVAK